MGVLRQLQKLLLKEIIPKARIYFDNHYNRTLHYHYEINGPFTLSFRALIRTHRVLS